MTRARAATMPVEIEHGERVAAEMLRAASAYPEQGGEVRVADALRRRAVEVPASSPVNTARFSLRPLCVKDKGEFLRVLAVSGHLDRFMPLRHPGERDEAVFARHLAMSRNGDQSGVAWRRVAVDADGRIVGGFNLVNIERGLAYRADANWWVAGDCLRQRIATECVYAMLDLALGDAPAGLGLHEVHAHVQLENEPSLRLVSRVGMRETGERPQTLLVGERWLVHRSHVKSVLDRA
jgi:ribosomal-protein-alanine N-acetyltransferase